MSKSWFVNWFDTEYYHVLYGNKRTDEEAYVFIESLVKHYQFNKDVLAWDMSCGKGRHARALHHYGFKVMATDLSKASIHAARQASSPDIDFAVHDMRQTLMSNYFDLVGNFFTSFGYFKSKYQDEKIVKNAHKALKPNGFFILDFLNVHKLNGFKSLTEEKEINGVQYHIHKYVKDHTIYKEIKVLDGDKEMIHKEQVCLYTKEDLISLFEKSHFHDVKVYGNYKFDAFDLETSERTILIARK